MDYGRPRWRGSWWYRGGQKLPDFHTKEPIGGEDKSLIFASQCETEFCEFLQPIGFKARNLKNDGLSSEPVGCWEAESLPFMKQHDQQPMELHLRPAVGKHRDQTGQNDLLISECLQGDTPRYKGAGRHHFPDHPPSINRGHLKEPSTLVPNFLTSHASPSPGAVGPSPQTQAPILPPCPPPLTGCLVGPPF